MLRVSETYPGRVGFYGVNIKNTMKKIRILSLINAVVTLATAAVYVVTIVISVNKLNAPVVGADKFVTERTAKLNAVAGTFGIIISIALALLSLLVTYYSAKIAFGGDEFYGDRKSGIVFFAVLSLVAALICLALSQSGRLSAYKTCLYCLGGLYCSQFALPIVELIISDVKRKREIAAENGVCSLQAATVESVKKELEKEAETIEKKL